MSLRTNIKLYSFNETTPVPFKQSIIALTPTTRTVSALGLRHVSHHLRQ